MNYVARIIKVGQVLPVENADKLEMTIVEGNPIVISKSSIKTGDLMIYFPTECQISQWYLSIHNMYSDAELNSNKEIKGYFSKSGRVKSVKLRGQISSGLLMPVSSITQFVKSPSYKEGLEFDTVGDKLLVKKYVVVRTPGTPGSKLQKSVKGRIISKVIGTQFRFHIDTPQFARNVHAIHLDEVVNITRKMHGTSGISSYVICNKQLPWNAKIGSKIGNGVAKFLRLLGGKKCDISADNKDYDHLYSSRRVVKNESANTGFYTEDIWKEADEVVKPALIKGMTMYYEICGYLRDGKMIQSGYRYGCDQPTKDMYEYDKNFKIFVYRITMTNPDGIVIEMPADFVTDYCKSVGLKSVQTLYRGTLRNLFDNPGKADLKMLDAAGETEFIHNRIISLLSTKYLEKQAVDCDNNPDEGIVIRKNTKDLEVYKFKSQAFYLKESKELDKGEVNIEE